MDESRALAAELEAGGERADQALKSLQVALWAAWRRVRPVAQRTPVMRSRTLDDLVGAHVFLKCENFQRMGAFKFRGAWNLMSQLPRGARERGVVAYSSGNHAQAVALAARELGMSAVIVMPSTAPAPKIEAVREYGAAIEFYDRAGESREEMAQRIASEQGRTLVPPFDHPHIIAGQGTASLELFEEAGPMDALIAPVGGGGLLAGAALAASTLLFPCEAWGIEPETADDGRRSLESGTLQRIEDPATIADGARTPSLGVLNFAIMKELGVGIGTATDDEMIHALRFAFERLKLVLEPTGALALAALLHGRVKFNCGRIGVILSGGNVDPAMALRWMSGSTAA